jgi:hypothetical protein
MTPINVAILYPTIVIIPFFIFEPLLFKSWTVIVQLLLSRPWIVTVQPLLSWHWTVTVLNHYYLNIELLLPWTVTI